MIAPCDTSRAHFHKLSCRVGLGFAPDHFEGALGDKDAFVFAEIGKPGFRPSSSNYRCYSSSEVNPGRIPIQTHRSRCLSQQRPRRPTKCGLMSDIVVLLIRGPRLSALGSEWPLRYY